MYTERDAIAYGLQTGGCEEIRDHQRRIIQADSRGRKDVFLSTPTGSEKSLTFEDFEVAPYVFYYLENGERCYMRCHVAMFTLFGVKIGFLYCEHFAIALVHLVACFDCFNSTI